jgi:HEAT repeat protein
VAPDRDAARLRIAHAGLTQTAVEHVSRASFGRMPITLVDRARAQLRRFFSEGPWTVEDDAGLSGLVGPGEGWTEEELAPGIRLGYGWRFTHFKIEVEADPVVAAPNAGGHEPATEHLVVPAHERTLGDTFEEFVVIEVGRNPAEVRFATGPLTTATGGRFTRDNQGTSAAVAALFREFDEIQVVRLEKGSVSVALHDAHSWHTILLRVFDTVTSAFVPPRVVQPDRAYERAVSEIGALDVASPRDLARLLDATSSPDPAFRRLAAAKLEIADPLLVAKPWTHSLEDSSRAVRRAAIRAAAHVARPDLRLLFERALSDKDACVRYYALRGLAQIGVGRADQSVERRQDDDDLRVRIAAAAALAGRLPL